VYPYGRFELAMNCRLDLAAAAPVPARRPILALPSLEPAISGERQIGEAVCQIVSIVH
jgi:hypothetical protein